MRIPGIISTILRSIGAISLAFVLINAALLLYPGGTVMVREATLEGTTSPAYIVRQPIFHRPHPFSLFSACLRGNSASNYRFIFGRGICLTGVLFLFSLGIYIAFVGIITLLVAFVLYQQTA